MLTEAAFVAVSTPGPMRAFYERVRARRGSQIAIVAVARKLAVLFWHLLTREQDYAFARPSLTRKKLRALELRAGGAERRGERGLASTNTAKRTGERELAEQAEIAYGGSSPTGSRGPEKKGAGATPGRASEAARQASAPGPAL